MAKQSGLHQIRGKVGEHSYYRQTGVTNGLIRSINQGMSSRVKIGDEYANTRLNNAEFGQAGRIAKVLGTLITPKYRPMILPFSQSKMAKIILAAIKTDNAPWGQRNIPSTNGARVTTLITALNEVSKNEFDDFGISVVKGELNEVRMEIADPQFANKMNSIGAEGCKVTVVHASPVIGLYAQGSGNYVGSYARANYYNETLEIGDQSAAFQPSFPPSVPEGVPFVNVNFFIFILMPYRSVSGQEYILQEHCTYKAMEIPA